MKKIMGVTGNRAEYGILKKLFSEIKHQPNFFDFKLAVTGAHLSDFYGDTKSEILSDQINIDFEVDIDLSREMSHSLVLESFTKACNGFGKVFKDYSPDCILVLGDRYEILGVAIAAFLHKIPIVHFHGGEVTNGSLDDSMRHAISKMATLHFVCTEEYRQRLIRMGESPNAVFNFGSLSIDAMSTLPLLNRVDLERDLEIKFRKKNILVTYHPDTKTDKTKNEVVCLLDALKAIASNEVGIFFTFPNADAGGYDVINSITNFIKSTSNAYIFKSLGQIRYLSLLRECDAVLGNSSSGIIEAPSLGTPTINIGNRQSGRLSSESVISVFSDDVQLVVDAIYKSLSLKSAKKNFSNPYDQPNTTIKVIDILKNFDFSEGKASFYDAN